MTVERLACRWRRMRHGASAPAGFQHATSATVVVACLRITTVGDAGIVAAVISMADSLHMEVVAEGVETRQQLACLEKQSCPEAQGFYFSQPLVAGDLTELLWRSEWEGARRFGG